MSPEPTPTDFADVVRRNARLTIGFIWSRRPPCIHLGALEARNVPGRTIRTIHSVPARLPPSWTLGVLLCPGDDTASIAAFAKKLWAPDRRRIQFYMMQGLDVAAAFRAWSRDGLGRPDVVLVAGFPALHRHFGLFLNLWTYRVASAPG